MEPTEAKDISTVKERHKKPARMKKKIVEYIVL